MMIKKKNGWNIRILNFEFIPLVYFILIKIGMDRLEMDQLNLLLLK